MKRGDLIALFFVMGVVSITIFTAMLWLPFAFLWLGIVLIALALAATEKEREKEK